MKKGIISRVVVYLMDKFVYALNLIVDFIDTNEIVNEHVITNYLSFTGFDEQEIRRIFALLGIDNKSSPSGFRIFSNKEKQFFTAEALTYLNKLLLSGVIDFISAEKIIERVYEDGLYKISVDQLKEITLFTLLEKQEKTYNDSDFSEDVYN